MADGETSGIEASRGIVVWADGAYEREEFVDEYRHVVPELNTCLLRMMEPEGGLG